MRRESPSWWFWMAMCAGAILPLATGVAVWIVLRIQGKPVLSVSNIVESAGLWLVMSSFLAVSALPTAILVLVLVKERSGAWVRGAAWGMLLGLSATMIAMFGSLWRNAGTAIELVVLAPPYFAVMHTIGAVAGGGLGALAVLGARAVRAARGRKGAA